ncbi:MAG: hypothetical protein HY774_04345 [Acidobacteria bacterium]|nr:hypothetical protein [Acidobacteriota bacterium]
MFAEIFRFEMNYRFKRISTYVYFGLWFLMGFLYTSTEGLSIGVGGKVLKNGPYGISLMTAVLGAFGVMITSAIFGTAIHRDFEQNTYSTLFTTPLTRRSYLGGRFLASYLVMLLVYAGIPLGMLIGGLMPWADKTKLMPVHLANYFQPFLVLAVPSIFLTGALFFLVGALSRSLLAVYLQGVVFFALYLITLPLIREIGNDTLPGLADPLGIVAINIITKYWTVAERNSQLLPMTGVLLYNRLIWVGVGVMALALVMRFFTFSSEMPSFLGSRKKKVQADEPAVPKPAHLELPVVRQLFSGSTRWLQFLTLTRLNFLSVVKEIPFMAIVFIGMFILMLNGSQAGKFYGTQVFPVTYIIIEVIQGGFSLFFIILITMYAGELVWKERGVKFDQIHDALPLPGFLTYLSQLSALTLVYSVLLLALTVVGMGIQVWHGYFKFELALYLKEAFFIQLPSLMQVTAVALLAQTVLKNKFLGHAVVILFFMSLGFISEFGLEHKLYRYSSNASYVYSDMNGFGHFAKPMLWFTVYWTACAGLLAVLTVLLSVKGVDTSWKARVQNARQNLRFPLTAILALLAVTFVGSGVFIFYNTNILNKYQTSDAAKAAVKEYEKLYKKYEKIPQPRITAVKLNVDLFPETREFRAKGSYVLENKTKTDITAIHVTDQSDTIKNLNFSRQVKETLKDVDHSYRIYELPTPLKPGEQIELAFEVEEKNPGFRNSGENNSIVENGTFFNSSYFPKIGYQPDAEMRDEDERKKLGLPPRPGMAPPDNLEARMNTYIANDADWTTFNATVSTSPDQIAIAPGYLQREWLENGRRYFEYQMEAKVLHFFAVLSGRYQVKRDRWNDVNIEIYYHPAHAYNLDRMIQSVKKSLDYYTINFGPYQHKQFRIIEFPRYASFAQSFPNTIPYSESIGFIARVVKDDDIDYPFYVTAHELAHQWWAHQVIGGNVQGSTLLAETLSQYSALMVMEKEYGKEKMRKFLKYELDRYLRGRTAERKNEPALAYVEAESYVYYQKGSLVMYALKDYIGEDRVNAALKKFIKECGFQNPPFTNSLEFLKYIREVTPPEMQYLITDLFETITLFENRAIETSYSKTPDGKYLVKLKVDAKKLRADGSGDEKEIAINDLIDIGVFSGEKKKEKVLHLQKYRIDKAQMEFEITVDEEPARAGIDPYNKLIDRNSDDNVIEVSQKSQTGKPVGIKIQSGDQPSQIRD